MAKSRKIYTIEDENELKTLRAKSASVSKQELQSKEFKEFVEDLLYTALHSEEQGNVPAGGIAAVQVGNLKRVFYSLNYDTDQWELFINPQIDPVGFLKSTTDEGCLSIPNITGPVTRYFKVKIKYQDINGEWKTKRFQGINATSVQHEYDHLEGILFTDKIKK